ncbi:expressed unknown protein [Seminavis robusta]|uniref:Uncharacterized protein n=1 Tax=Seminavis robusta TaxID=568900 RepID=A0A9N8DMA0_9STRA|nr:expressed unknown protein [Seminavis robusta]|eukprot:Sro204_g085940.1 n/a (81) ;mRNA; f:52005-52247
MDISDEFLPIVFIAVFFLGFCNAMNSSGPRVGVPASCSYRPSRDDDNGQASSHYVDGSIVWGGGPPDCDRGVDGGGGGNC